MKKEGRELVSLALVAFVLIAVMPFVLGIEITPSATSPSSGTTFTITSLRYEPYPVAPGETFDLWVKVSALGSSNVANATCKIIEGYPFSVYQDLSSSYGKIYSGDSVVFQYRLKTDQNSADGSNELQVWCSENPASQSWSVEKVNIIVQTRYSTLDVVNIATTPSVVSPGGAAKLSFTLENSAYSAMKDIVFKLDLSGADIAPYQEVAEKKIALIEGGASKNVEFNIKAMPSAKGGVYKIPFSMMYTDNLGKAYNQTGLISVEIASKPELVYSIDSTTISDSNKIGTFDVKVVNSGLTDLKFLSIKIKDSSDFKLLSPDNVYIGDIDSDDFGTATFRISAGTFVDSFDVPLEVTYRDILNNQKTEKVSLKFQVLSDKEMGKPASKTGIIISFIILVIICLFIFLKSWREKAVSTWKFIRKKFGK